MIVQVYARLDAALVKELRRKALELDINQPTAVAQAIEQWLKPPVPEGDLGGIPEKPATVLTSVAQWEHEALSEILESEFATAIRENLKAFRRAAAVLREPATGRPRNDRGIEEILEGAGLIGRGAGRTGEKSEGAGGSREPLAGLAGRTSAPVKGKVK